MRLELETDVRAGLMRAKGFVEEGLNQILAGQLDEKHGVSPSPGATALATLALLALGRDFGSAERKGSRWLRQQRQPLGWSKFPGGQADAEVSRLAMAVIQGSQGGLLGRIALLSQARQFSDMILSLGERMVPGLEGPDAGEVSLPKILEPNVLKKLPPYGRPVVIAAALLAAETHQSGVGRALEFLAHSQMQDGSWSEDIAATSMGILAFIRFRFSLHAAHRAGHWLLRKQYNNGAWPAFDQLQTWSGGWALNILGSGGPEEGNLLTEVENWLRAGQNADGSYGSTPPSTHPDLDDTAVALMGLSSSPASRRGIELIKRLQNEDGSWGTFPDFDGVPPEISSKAPVYIQSPDVTVHVLEALWKHRQPADESAIHRGLSWLLSQQNGDGFLPATWYQGQIYATAQFVELLSRWRFRWEYLKTGRRIHQTRKIAQDFLLSSQNEDGSWGSSPVETALALAALWRFDQRVPASVLERGVIKLMSWQKPDGTFLPSYGGIYAKGWNYEEPLSTALTGIRALERYLLER